MSDASNPFRLFDMWRRRADDAAQSEPADMGTAFGLDLSLNMLLSETPPVPAARVPSWVSRLSLRRKQAV